MNNIPITHVVYLPQAYPWTDALSDHGERYLQSRGVDDYTFFIFRDAGAAEGVAPFSVSTYAMPDRPNLIEDAEPIPADWLPSDSSDGFPQFVAQFARQHQEVD